MVVCKFFLEGYCRFGNRCKFEHDTSYQQYDLDRSSDYSNERQSGSSILRVGNSSFNQRQDFSKDYSHNGFQQSQQHSSSQNTTFGLKYSVHEIIQAVAKDVAQAEAGNQWQLSVYSPLRELPNVPGLDDHSPEELRWECYKAAENGSIPLWQAIVQQLFANVAKVNNDLKKKDTGFAIIDMWLRGVEEKNSEINISSTGGSQVISSTFSSVGTASGFGAATGSTQSIFGGHHQKSAVFIENKPSPGFGATNTSSSIFGGSSFSPLPNTSPSVFGRENAMTTTSSLGGMNTNSVSFGGSNAMATLQGLGGNNATPSVFGGSSTMTTSNVSPFFSQTQVQNSFSFSLSPQTASLQQFSPTPQPLSPQQFSPSTQIVNQQFPPSPPNPQQFSPGSSVFNSNRPAFSNQTSSPFSSLSSSKIEMQHYSTVEELNTSELDEFKADKFTFRSIPTKPPPRALCGL